MCQDDFFLSSYAAEITEKARILVFQVFFKTNNSFDLKFVASKLGKKPAEAEKWVKTVLEDANLEAEIDSKSSTVQIKIKMANIQSQIYEKTRSLLSRTNQLFNSVNTKSVKK